ESTADNDLNDISLVATAGNSTIAGLVTAGPALDAANGDITITATTGTIVDEASDLASDVIGDVVTLTAQFGIGETAGAQSLDTSANTLNLHVTLAGIVNLEERNAVTL